MYFKNKSLLFSFFSIILGVLGTFFTNTKDKALIGIMGPKAFSLNINDINLISNLLQAIYIIFLILILLTAIYGNILIYKRKYSSKGIMHVEIAFILSLFIGFCSLGQVLLLLGGLKHLLINDKINY